MPDIAPGFARFGNAWLWWYALPHVRAQAIIEMSAVKAALKVESIVILTSVGADFSWPVPTDAELSRLVALVHDAKACGLRTYLLIGNPGILPNAAIPANIGPNFVHVGGHKAGEIVNGTRLWWDVPFYGPDYIDLAVDWYTRIGQALVAYCASGSISGFIVCGMPHLPFATEANVFHDGYPWRGQTEAYYDALLFHLRGALDLPLGISLLPSVWNPVDPFDGMRWFTAHHDLGLLDILDVSAYSGAFDPAALKVALGGRQAILSDGMVEPWAEARTRATWLTSAAVNPLGWWIWQYKQEAGQRGGVRRPGYLGESCGWSGAQAPMRASTAPLRGVRFNPEIIQV